MDVLATRSARRHDGASRRLGKRRQVLRVPPALLGWVIVGSIIAAGIALRTVTLTTYEHDYDEAVYWSSLRAMLHGHPLFAQVFSSQPPLFLLAIYPFFAGLGQAIWSARLGVLVFSVVAMVALYGLGRVTGGRLCGLVAVILFALDPLARQQSQSLQAEMPALALALLALLAAYGVRRFGRKAALASGIAFGLSSMIKLITPPFVVPIVLVLLAAAVEGANAQTRQIWGTAWPAQALSAGAGDIARRLAGLLALFIVGTILAIAVVVAPFIGAWHALYSQVIAFHLHAGAGTFPSHLQVIESEPSEYLLDSAAILSAIIALARRQWQAVPLIAWYGTSIAYLFKLTPLFYHHLVILAPVAALLVGLLFAPAQRPAISLPRIVDAGDQRAAPHLRWRGILAALLLLAIVGVSLGYDIEEIRAELTYNAAPILREVRAIDRLAAPDAWVLTDDQFIAALANRDVPPALVDTSEVRIASGSLTSAQLIAAVENPRVAVVLFSSGRFRELPGFVQWAEGHLRLVHDYGGGVELYGR
jgi:hypothetical protein